MLALPAKWLKWGDSGLGWEQQILSDQIDKGMKQILSDPLLSAETPHNCRKWIR